jgi:hypothetical protein
MWKDPLKNLRYPIKGHLTARIMNNKLQILGGMSLSMIEGNYALDEISFIVGTEGGLI